MPEFCSFSSICFSSAFISSNSFLRRVTGNRIVEYVQWFEGAIECQYLCIKGHCFVIKLAIINNNLAKLKLGASNIVARRCHPLLVIEWLLASLSESNSVLPFSAAISTSSPSSSILFSARSRLCNCIAEILSSFDNATHPFLQRRFPSKLRCRRFAWLML